ncbi:MAG: c-type cytochrome domain-containing protein, partial [Sediminibacterium sp.]
MGHLHPIIVHLPIGILLFGVCMMLIQHYKNIDLNQVISLAFLLGSICAAFACLTGWLLSKSDEYDVLLVQKHQWSGIVTTVLGLLTYVLKQYRKLFAIALTLLILITGHYGGTLTHGDNYLFNVSEGSNTIAHDTLKTTSKRNTQEISIGSDTLKLVRSNLYKDEVAPLLKMRCYNCHSAIKQKNGLRLDGEMFIKRGGKNGTVVVAGNIFKSPLYTSLNLPIEDEKHMPPKGKQQLNEVEILIIEHWIKSGASFEDKIDTITNKELSSNTATRKNSVDTISSNYKNINTAATIITRDI